MSENPKKLELAQWFRGAFTKEELEYLNSQPDFYQALHGGKEATAIWTPLPF